MMCTDAMCAMSLNWVAILIATAIYMGLGMLWYSPLMFGTLWAKEMGKSMDEKMPPKLIAGAFLVAFAISFGLACMVNYLHLHGTIKGAMFGFCVALYFIIPVIFSNVLWSGKPFKVFLIDSAFFLVYLPAMGGLMGMMG